MNIGLTGGIACGKSTVAQMLANAGSILIDADQIAREVVEPGRPALLEIIERFGDDILHEDGTLNRKKLGQTIFQDTAARTDLESILHPKIRKLMFSRMAQAEAEHPKRLVVLDIPLLYESGLQERFEAVMVVYVPKAIQILRLMERDAISQTAARQRLKAQMPIDEKKELADIVIDNSGTPERTMQQLDEFLRGKGLQ